MKRLSLSVWIACTLTACATPSVPNTCESVVFGDGSLPVHALVQRTGVAEAESKNMYDGVPFGSRNREWNQLKDAIEPGDELWFYRDNRVISGAEGYVLVRDCEVVAFVMTTKY